MKKTYMAWLFGIAAIAFFAVIIVTAPAFKHCIQDEQKASAGKPPAEQPSALYSDCSCFFYSMHESHGIITAYATFLIGLFTLTLWLATDKLRILSENAELTARTHERAYIIGGGPYGDRPKDPGKNLLAGYHPKASDFFGPWQMTIQNYGRTAGYIFCIKWGLCPEKSFKALSDTHGTVTNVIAEFQRLEKRGERLPDDAEIHEPPNVDDTFPSNVKEIRNRHVQFEEREPNISKIFFGRIDYRDAFGDKHWSTFKLRLTKDHSDPLPGCYSDEDKG